jgi:hypothetical protein
MEYNMQLDLNLLILSLNFALLFCVFHLMMTVYSRNAGSVYRNTRNEMF